MKLSPTHYSLLRAASQAMIEDGRLALRPALEKAAYLIGLETHAAILEEVLAVANDQACVSATCRGRTKALLLMHLIGPSGVVSDRTNQDGM